MHNGYQVVRDLISEYGLTPEVAPNGRAIFSSFTASPLESQDLSTFMLTSIQALIDNKTLTLPSWLSLLISSGLGFFKKI